MATDLVADASLKFDEHAARPIGVLASLWKSSLRLRERVLAGWLGLRGMGDSST